ncbi:MAG TPA: HNH endonuclease [Burkholderiaceae bacterium]|nr:HNH endonuclease [Burkholderiaceae bacterium]
MTFIEGNSPELWRPVLGTSNRYQVSNHGNVMGPRGPLKPTLMAIGYYSVALSLGQGVVRRQYVHKLVVESFIGDQPGLVIDHINGNKLDNRLDNLELVTRQTNAKRWVVEGRGNAGRKSSGFCSRGHEIPGGKLRCQECIRLRLNGHEFTPPSDTTWLPAPFDGYLVSADGRIWSKKHNKLLKPGTNKPGYKYVNIRADGKTQNWAVSRLVATVFIGSISDQSIVDHINGDKSDNSVSNLRIISRSENTSHFRQQRKDKGLHGYKYTEAEIAEIRKLIEEGRLSRIEIQSQFGISQSFLSAIATGKAWKHIS